MHQNDHDGEGYDDEFEDGEAYDGDYDGEGYDTSKGVGGPDEVVVTDSATVLDALQKGVRDGITTMTSATLPRIVERAVVKAICENTDVQKVIRSIVGGRINKGLAPLNSRLGLEPLSKGAGTAAAPAGGGGGAAVRVPGGRTIHDLIQEAQQIQEATGRKVEGLSAYLMVPRNDTLGALIKGVEEARAFQPSKSAA